MKNKLKQVHFTDLLVPTSEQNFSFAVKSTVTAANLKVAIIANQNVVACQFDLASRGIENQPASIPDFKGSQRSSAFIQKDWFCDHHSGISRHLS